MNVLASHHILPHLKASSKKQALQEIAKKASEMTGLQERMIYDVMMERERLGSTGVGQGVAIPHGKLAQIPSVQGFFARLDTPIDFEAIDGQPVDLMFVLLSPLGAGSDHLKALAWVSRQMRDARLREKLRGSATADAMFALLSPMETSQAA